MKASLEYNELDLHSHTLKRPDTYVGSTREHRENEYVAVTTEEGDTRIQSENVTYTPAVLRIFVEALSNAVDNVVRSEEFKVACKQIKVTINKETGETSVWNDGMSIPIRKRETDGLYIPEMLFGRLLTSSNYNDDEERYTSGRNGLGISLTNIFSSRFGISLLDPETRSTYKQTWKYNMKQASKPSVRATSKTSGFTEVSWTPDFEYFGLSGYTEEMIQVMQRYVLDAAMITGLIVTFNGARVPVRSFKEYSKLLAPPGSKELVHFQHPQSQCMLMGSEKNRDFQSLSFVNGVYTRDGGVHVDAWTDAIFKSLTQKINQKYKSIKLTVKDIKPYFTMVVHNTCPNPEFSTQSKTKLTNPKPSPSPTVSDKQIGGIMKWAFIEHIKKMVEAKELLSLKKSERKSRNNRKVEGFDPANKAGGKESHKCTLILCEGLSAKTYAVTGIKEGIDFGAGVLKGRDYNGILALKGKCLNARNASVSSIAGNKEIMNIIQVLGVQYGVDYTAPSNFKQLRYGRIMILSDEDCDGLHIQALIINLFDVLFPSLLQRNDFILRMQTPIVKLEYKGKVHRFYEERKAKEYLEKHPHGKFKIKYYKGLGTSSDKDVAETFGKRVIVYTNDVDAQRNLDTTFNKDFSDLRKTWIANYNESDIVMRQMGDSKFQMDISEFINKEMIKFSISDCKRSIPHLMDGLKESQRKILHACFIKNLSTTPLKVAQLAGFVAEKTNYHHGEACLFDTITKMAQDFVGSNNIPLLYRDGQFGSRNSNGKDAANARYIYTRLESATRLVFPKHDDPILSYIQDDGDSIEPDYFAPVIPMVLANGVSGGIGTGWSSSVPCYNPVDLIHWIRAWLGGRDPISIASTPLTPWYRGFTGVIRALTTHKFETEGCMHQDKRKVTITEIPIGVSIDRYKDTLDDLIDAKVIKSVKNYSQPNRVNFELTLHSDERITLDKLKLRSTISTSNMVMFSTPDNCIRKFKSPHDVLSCFCKRRLVLYVERRQYLLDELENERAQVQSKLSFLQSVMTGALNINHRDEDRVVEEMASIAGIIHHNGSFDYLLSLPIRSFSEQKLSALKNKLHDLRSRLKVLKKTTAEKIWEEDLTALEKALH